MTTSNCWLKKCLHYHWIYYKIVIVVSIQKRIFEISLAVYEPRAISNISLQAGINNISAMVCDFLAFKTSSTVFLSFCETYITSHTFFVFYFVSTTDENNWWNILLKREKCFVDKYCFNFLRTIRSLLRILGNLRIIENHKRYTQNEHVLSPH